MRALLYVFAVIAILQSFAIRPRPLPVVVAVEVEVEVLKPLVTLILPS